MPQKPQSEMTPKELWADEERKKRLQAKIDAAKARSEVYDGPETADDADLRDDWNRFTQVAKISFPEYLAARFELSNDQRKAAIAHCLGWSQSKIQRACGKSETIIRHWYSTIFGEAISSHMTK